MGTPWQQGMVAGAVPLGEVGGGVDMKKSALGTAVTVGVLLKGLQDLLASIDNLISSAGGEARILLGSLRASVANTLVEFENLMGDDLEHTIDNLDDVQRGFAHNVERLLLLGQRAVQTAVSGVTESALTLIREADIAAYDTLYALPGRPQTPRLVYWMPKEIPADGTESVVELRGNFLNVQPPKAKVDGVDVPVAGAANNMTQIRLSVPASGIPAAGTYRKVNLEYASCESRTCFLWEDCQPKMGTVPASASIKVTPKKLYTVRATITPSGRQTERTTFSRTFFRREESCTANINDMNEHCVDPGWRLDSPLPTWPNVTQKNCGSDVSQLNPAGSTCMQVRYTIKGCGCIWAPWPASPNCSHPDPRCKGRGWLGYTLNLPAMRLVDTNFTTLSFQQVNTTDRAFTFRYNQPLPAGAQVDRWLFTVNITSSTGGSVALSEANPSTPQAHATVSPDGTLVVQIDDPQLVMLGGDSGQRMRTSGGL